MDTTASEPPSYGRGIPDAVLVVNRSNLKLGNLTGKKSAVGRGRKNFSANENISAKSNGKSKLPFKTFTQEKYKKSVKRAIGKLVYPNVEKQFMTKKRKHTDSMSDDTHDLPNSDDKLNTDESQGNDDPKLSISIKEESPDVPAVEQDNALQEPKTESVSMDDSEPIKSSSDKIDDTIIKMENNIVSVISVKSDETNGVQDAITVNNAGKNAVQDLDKKLSECAEDITKSLEFSNSNIYIDHAELTAQVCYDSKDNIVLDVKALTDERRTSSTDMRDTISLLSGDDDKLTDDHISIPDDAEIEASLMQDLDSKCLEYDVGAFFHGRNSASDLHFSHCIIGALIKEDYPQLVWNDDCMTFITGEADRLIKVFQASRRRSKLCADKSSKISQNLCTKKKKVPTATLR